MKLYNKYKQFTEIIQFQELEWYIYFNNKDKILPVIADKEEYIKNNILTPENSGYKIILSTNKNSTDNNFVFHDKKLLFDSISESNLVPKCVKVIRKYKEKEKETSVYFDITYKLDKHCKGKFPSNLFISYGYELQGLYRQYFDIPEINNKFMICSNCNKYTNIPSQKELVNCVKEKFKNKQLKLINENYNYNDINILSFSVDNNMNIYPYCVFDYVYNCNSYFPFLIIMLNTCKLFTLLNYRYEYVVSSDKNLFNFNDDFVQAIFSIKRISRLKGIFMDIDLFRNNDFSFNWNSIFIVISLL
ncbi:hypothetical protein BCR36DRAFT_450130 [Piromyces finnis]|uniref:Uncharacterized protein n=1 Tax=Piromyces finnis TaxID=1754191 RepID=A0A1Y1V857_9FUNG|nr:hypothetical protein BCR36DRAFT_450130 [Piromyces finnis]|eukprot:ORX49591.1 hypothetical protein BCR36DRAFT_450130 [Piromyces finnis]